MNKFTPGPYYLVEHDYSISIYRTWDSKVKPVNSETFGSCYGALIARVDHTNDGVPTKAQAVANATLLATAPELFEALEALVAELVEDGQEPNSEDLQYMIAIAKARAAIAKAKGQS